MGKRVVCGSAKGLARREVPKKIGLVAWPFTIADGTVTTEAEGQSEGRRGTVRRAHRHRRPGRKIGPDSTLGAVTEMSDVRVVLVTAGDREAGLALAREVVEEGLAACGNVLSDVTSVFAWDGGVQEEPEALLILKTSAERAPRLAERVAELHAYEVPEVLTLAVEGGHEPYLEWVRQCTRVESPHGQKEP